MYSSMFVNLTLPIEISLLYSDLLREFAAAPCCLFPANAVPDGVSSLNLSF